MLETETHAYHRQLSSASLDSDSVDLSGSGKFGSESAGPFSRSSSKTSGILSQSSSDSLEASRNVCGKIQDDSAVFLDCENKNMAAVKMSRDGTLSLAQASQAGGMSQHMWKSSYVLICITGLTHHVHCPYSLDYFQFRIDWTNIFHSAY